MDVNAVKALLFDTVIEQLFDKVIEQDGSDGVVELINKLGDLAEANGYERKVVVSACTAGLRKVMAEIEANKDPKRKSSGFSVTMMATRFLAFYYCLSQVRPKDLKNNEKWAKRAARIPQKDRQEVGELCISLFLLMVSNREIKRVLKGEELKRVLAWKREMKG